MRRRRHRRSGERQGWTAGVVRGQVLACSGAGQTPGFEAFQESVKLKFPPCAAPPPPAPHRRPSVAARCLRNSPSPRGASAPRGARRTRAQGALSRTVPLLARLRRRRTEGAVVRRLPSLHIRVAHPSRRIERGDAGMAFGAVSARGYGPSVPKSRRPPPPAGTSAATQRKCRGRPAAALAMHRPVARQKVRNKQGDRQAAHAAEPRLDG